MSVDARHSPFYAWIDYAAIRELVRGALDLSAGERLVLIKGLVPSLVGDSATRKPSRIPVRGALLGAPLASRSAVPSVMAKLIYQEPATRAARAGAPSSDSGKRTSGTRSNGRSRPMALARLRRYRRTDTARTRCAHRPCSMTSKSAIRPAA